MSETNFIRRAVLAGALALSLTGVTAGVDMAQAMPVAATLAQTVAPSDVTLAQYQRYPHARRYYRHRRAGLYRCGRGGLHTHLARQACR